MPASQSGFEKNPSLTSHVSFNLIWVPQLTLFLSEPLLTVQLAYGPGSQSIHEASIEKNRMSQ